MLRYPVTIFQSMVAILVNENLPKTPEGVATIETQRRQHSVPF